MAIPLSYNIRNLIERKGTTLMTAAGIGLTVAVLVAAQAVRSGVVATFSSTGNPLHVIVLRKGVDAELSSGVSESAFQEIRLLSGVARGTGGEPMASPELVSVVNLPSVDNPDGTNVTVRGLTPTGIEMRDLRVKEGRWFGSGLREVTVGESVAKRYDAARVGSRIRFGRGEWTIVGVFTGGTSAANSEIWCDLNQLRSDFDRQGNMSSVLVRAASESDVANIIQSVEGNQRLGAAAQTEAKYYEKMQDSGAAMLYVGNFVAIIMAVGSGFGAMNTMYAAVARRTREIGTLRALGFSRWSILWSFVFESVALALLGGLLGVLLTLPLNWVTTGVANDRTFSEIAFNFRVGPAAIIPGLVFAIVIGALGGFLPARAASKKDLLAAMREP